MVAIQDLLYQLRLADQSMTQLFERQLGISLTRYQILCFLIDQSPCNQIAVQERLKIDQAALTRHFKILEKEGLVKRRRNPENQRELKHWHLGLEITGVTERSGLQVQQPQS